MLQWECVAEWYVRKTKVLEKSKFAGIAINCYLQGCSFSEPRWIFAFQRTCNPCCRILDLSAAVKRIWMGRIFQFYGLSWRISTSHHRYPFLQNVRHKHWICQTTPKGNPSFLIITFQKRQYWSFDAALHLYSYLTQLCVSTAISKPTNPVQLPGLSASATKQWKSGFKEGNKQRESGFKKEIMESRF